MSILPTNIEVVFMEHIHRGFILGWILFRGLKRKIRFIVMIRDRNRGRVRIRGWKWMKFKRVKKEIKSWMKLKMKRRIKMEESLIKVNIRLRI